MLKQVEKAVLVDNDERYQTLLTTHAETVLKLTEKTRENQELKQTLEGRDSRIEELEVILGGYDSLVEELRNENKELKRILAYFDNPNTPSSAKQPGSKGKKGKKGKSEKSTKKQGAQPGHKGKTNKPKPTILALHVPTECDNCDDSDLEVQKVETRNITNIHVTVNTAKHVLYRGHCKNCGKCTKPPECPTILKPIAADADEQDTEMIMPEIQNVSDATEEAPVECGQTCAATPEQVATPEIQNVSDATEEAPPECGAMCDSESKQDVEQESASTGMPKVYGNIPRSVVQCAAQVLPKRGEYGLGVLLATVMSFMDRLPFRLNSAAWARCGVDMSSGTVHNILYSTGMNLTGATADILRRIRKAYILHADETSISRNGIKVWIWIFRNPETGESYFVIRPSRGGDVVDEVLGKNWDGWLVCDGWTAYKGRRLQRCWAHILTAIRHVVERNPQCAEAEEVLDALRKIYEIGCEVGDSPTERRRVRALLDKRVRRIVAKYKDVPELKSFITKLSNARPNLFHFVTNKRIPPTNNEGERGLREIVVHRKVRGSLRADDTMTWLGNLFSCISTWKECGLDVQKELAKYV